MPSCDRPTVWPAIVSCVERLVGDPLFDPMPTTIVPLPVPNPGLTLAHVSPLEAVHEQFEPFIVMPIVPAPPEGPYGLPSPVVSSVALQASASWLIENACPPMTSDPDRPTVVEFGSIV